jgi:carbonic anhydrase
MNPQDNPSGREFVRDVGQATGVGASQLTGTGATASADQSKPDEVLQRLIEGNKRYAEGKLEHPGRSPMDFQPLAEGQAPLAIILGCADSRVSPEILFDQGVGDLFVVRVAGNMVGSGPILKGSIEFAVAILGVRLILVLGHSECGACKSAVKFIDDKDTLQGSIEGMVDYIRPVVRMVAGKPGDKLANVIKANVTEGVKKLQGLDPILSKMVKSGELMVVGGVYDLKTGKVEMVE